MVFVQQPLANQEGHMGIFLVQGALYALLGSVTRAPLGSRYLGTHEYT